MSPAIKHALTSPEQNWYFSWIFILRFFLLGTGHSLAAHALDIDLQEAVDFPYVDLLEREVSLHKRSHVRTFQPLHVIQTTLTPQFLSKDSVSNIFLMQPLLDLTVSLPQSQYNVIWKPEQGLETYNSRSYAFNKRSWIFYQQDIYWQND